MALFFTLVFGHPSPLACTRKQSKGWSLFAYIHDVASISLASQEQRQSSLSILLACMLQKHLKWRIYKQETNGIKSCHAEGLVPQYSYGPGTKKLQGPTLKFPQATPPGAVFLFYALYHTTCSFPTYIQEYMDQDNQMWINLLGTD